MEQKKEANRRSIDMEMEMTVWEYILWGIIVPVMALHYIQLIVNNWNYERREREFADGDKIVTELNRIMHIDPSDYQGDLGDLLNEIEDIHDALIYEFESKNRKEWISETIQRNLSKVPFERFLPNSYTRTK